MHAHTKFSFLTAIALVSTCLFQTGCGGDETAAPELAPVKGKVMLDGNPLPDATVRFAPESNGAPSTGKTGPDGAFTLTYRDDTPGAAIGSHRVTVTIGGPTPEQEAALKASAEGDGGTLPPTDIAPLKTHNETITVADGDNDITINFDPTEATGGKPRNSAER